MSNIKFKNLPDTEKPRERFMNNGLEAMTNEDLIAIILKTGNKSSSVKALSLEVLSLVDNINNLKDISLNNLIKINGIGKVKAIELLSAIELGRRIYNDKKEIKKYNIHNCNDIVKYYNTIFKYKNQEEFYVIYLDTKNNIISQKKLFVGTLNRSIVHPREIFKEAYLLSADKIVCIHNHPSADTTPSIEDINITRMILEIAIIHNIKLLDHIIIGAEGYYSFFENGNIIK